jgi:hypothetical protein
MPGINDMYSLLANQYMPEQGQEYGLADEVLRKKRRMQMLAAPMMGFGQYGMNQPAQPEQGMASDIFSAIGNPLGGMIPNILSAIFKKRG